MTLHNENTRVKIPCILHLVRLGYQYLSLKGVRWDMDTNIFTDIFSSSIARINPGLKDDDINRLFEDVKLSLDNEDLGKAFFEKLTARSNTRLIDFEHFDNNSFHVVTELTYQNGDDEFRPDITLLINGMPLVFIEVKKPNNREGILAERERINQRFQNPKFRRFFNITQFMIFSNNMEYDDSDPEPIQGAYYASSSYNRPVFNFFREEEVLNLTALLKPERGQDELAVLKDTNLEVIRSNPEFISNKEPNRPTNRICSSLLNRERLAFILRYALVYVAEEDGLQKHIMRYPQLFATKAIEKTLDSGTRKGIIWHTQGSGKTALAFYNVQFLTDYFQKQHVIPKFYFIVDRISLLIQATKEFAARGLIVHTVNSREAFANDIKTTQVIHNHTGQPEITVVNIQKFADDPSVVSTRDYNVNIQRVYFLDEVHRSYNPNGSFLANLGQSDRKAIKVGLTGTPIILSKEQKEKREKRAAPKEGEEEKKDSRYFSRELFGEYIHKYYYNASIADGYTLRLIREEISTSYKMVLRDVLAELKIKMGDVDSKEAYAHNEFVSPMLNYIVTDLEKSRGAHGDDSIGAMVICDSSKQAKEMFRQFEARVTPQQTSLVSDGASAYSEVLPLVAEQRPSYGTGCARAAKSAALILHDVGSKEERKIKVEDFKAGKIDILFVYNMLLTGFDAKRLKKLYMGRIILSHNLLQALTRVNRPYGQFRYGYVVDFADISKEFDATNKAYFDELQSELGDEMQHYDHLFKSQQEILSEIEHIKDILFRFNIENAEIFADQISEIKDRATMLELKKVLGDARCLYNMIRLQGEYACLDQLDFQKLNHLYRETCNHLELLNLKERLDKGGDIANLLNEALENIVFSFVKIGEEELVLADELKNTLRQTREAIVRNIDQKDPKLISLKEELERLFKQKKLSEVTQEEMTANIGTLNKIHERVKELNRENSQLRQKYHGDPKYTRIHKRLLESGGFNDSERRIFEALNGVKNDADEQVLQNTRMTDNESYFEKQLMPLVINRFMTEQNIKLNPDASHFINQLVVNEYLDEFNSRMVI